MLFQLPNVLVELIKFLETFAQHIILKLKNQLKVKQLQKDVIQYDFSYSP